MSAAAAEIILPTENYARCQAAAAVFELYLCAAPFSHALFRAAELAPLAGETLARPVLDLACGTGAFSVCVTDSPLETGLDRSQRRLALAAARGRYEFLVCADAEETGFADDTFASIICISVLEHVASPEAVVREAFRVLQPGGTFIASIVLVDIHDLLPSARALQKLGLPWAGRSVVAVHDRVFSHVSLHAAPFWEQLLIETGFSITESRKTVSADVMRWFELGLATAWPYRLSLALGRSWSWRPSWITRRMVRRFQDLVTEPEPVQGACLFVVARKPAGESVAHEPCRE